MGASTSLILGGLLGGIGRGMEQSVILDRQAALERLRQENEQSARDQQSKQRIVEADISNDYQMKRDEVQQGHQVERLNVAGTIQQRRDTTNNAHEERLVRLRGNEERLTAAAREALDDNDVQTTFVGADGNTRIVTNGGRTIDTGVPAREQAGQTEGGRLTESEQDTAYNEARNRWVNGGRQGPAPTRGDFIGMGRETYTRSRGGGTPAPAAPAPPPSRVIRYDAQGRRIG